MEDVPMMISFRATGSIVVQGCGSGIRPNPLDFHLVPFSDKHRIFSGILGTFHKKIFFMTIII